VRVITLVSTRYEPVEIPVPKRGVFDRLVERAEETRARD